MNEQELPLAGVRVFELCEVAAGPYCGLLLADLGADVVKVERPNEGDSLRKWPPIVGDVGATFATMNRNKRSILCDLRETRSRDALLSLILDTGDVVVQNYRPGVLAKYGLGPEDLCGKKPSLVYCSISAFGQTGPRAHQGGYDLTIQAAAGVMSVTGEADGPPVKCGAPVSDFSAGLYAALAVVSCLYARKSTGRGEHIDVPMYAATLAFSALQTAELFGTGRDPSRLGSAHPRNAPYRAFEASDGFFVIAAGSQKLWAATCAVAGVSRLVEDPRFLDQTARAANQHELFAILSPIFVRNGVGHWVKELTDAGVPCGPINTFSEALRDPQIAHLGLLTEVDLPGGAGMHTVLSPLILSGKTLPIRRRSPALGEHNAELLGTA